MRMFVCKPNMIIIMLAGAIFMFLVQFGGAHASSQPANIKVTSEAWLKATQKNGTGIYWDIIRLVYEPLGIKVEYNTTDYASSVSLVKQGKMDAWVGSYLDEEKGVIYPKWHLDADIVSAFYKKRFDFQWLGENSLAGKNVGWIKGYHYNKYIDVQFNNTEFSTREKAVELLEKGQLDFLLEAREELKNELKKGYFDTTKYEFNTLMHLNVYLTFADNERGLQLQKIFDQRFSKLLESGEIKKLFDKWNWPTYPFTPLCRYATSSMTNC